MSPSQDYDQQQSLVLDNDSHIQELVFLVDLSNVINFAITLAVLRPLTTDRAEDVSHIMVLQCSSMT
jgi:hypothetical protein